MSQGNITDQLLKVRVSSPEEIIFTGEALAVSSTNSFGKFDILPFHANYVTIVENQPITIRLLNKQFLTFKFPLAIIYISQNKVGIYTDIQFSS